MFIALGATDTFDMSKFVFDQCVLSFRVLNAFFLLYSSAPILRNTAVHISLWISPLSEVGPPSKQFAIAEAVL